jgi:hypothetical protein
MTSTAVVGSTGLVVSSKRPLDYHRGQIADNLLGLPDSLHTPLPPLNKLRPFSRPARTQIQWPKTSLPNHRRRLRMGLPTLLHYPTT